MSEKIERREFPAEVRIDGTLENRKITGHAAVFNTLTTLMPGIKEQIAPGAFADSISKDDVRALFNHDPNIVLGRNRSGTLSLKEDQSGLYYEVSPPNTQAAKDLITSIERGDISQNSFSFRTIDDGWDELEDGTIVRTLKKVKLFDISQVTFPQYPETDISLRSQEEVIAEGKAILAAGKDAVEEKKIKDLRRKLDLLELSS